MYRGHGILHKLSNCWLSLYTLSLHTGLSLTSSCSLYGECVFDSYSTTMVTSLSRGIVSSSGEFIPNYISKPLVFLGVGVGYWIEIIKQNLLENLLFDGISSSSWLWHTIVEMLIIWTRTTTQYTKFIVMMSTVVMTDKIITHKI